MYFRGAYAKEEENPIRQKKRYERGETIKEKKRIKEKFEKM